MKLQHIKKLPWYYDRPWPFRFKDPELDNMIGSFCSYLKEQGIEEEENSGNLQECIDYAYYEVNTLVFSKEAVNVHNFQSMLPINRSTLDLHAISLLRMMCFRCVVTGKRGSDILMNMIEEHFVQEWEG